MIKLPTDAHVGDAKSKEATQFDSGEVDSDVLEVTILDSGEVKPDVIAIHAPKRPDPEPPDPKSKEPLTVLISTSNSDFDEEPSPRKLARQHEEPKSRNSARIEFIFTKGEPSRISNMFRNVFATKGDKVDAHGETLKPP